MKLERLPKQSGVQATAQGSQAHRMLGRVLGGRYRIVDFVASGGMGRVYVAEQFGLERRVAVKVLDTRFQNNNNNNNNNDFRRRFKQEAALASRLAHPNIVVIHDYGVDGSLCFFVMEYLDGNTLEQEVRRTGPLDRRRLLHVTKQACSALAQAHRAGLVHRDLKPANLILTECGSEKDFLKIVDFGLVKELDPRGRGLQTKPGTLMGSPAYLSPEQVLGEDVTRATDVYLLGAAMFFMATGHPPFREETEYELLEAHVRKSPPYLRDVFPESDVSPQLEFIIRRCLSKSPADRFSTIDELDEALSTVESLFSDRPHEHPNAKVSSGPSSGLQLQVLPQLQRLPELPEPFPSAPPAPVAAKGPHSVPITLIDPLSLLTETEEDTRVRTETSPFRNSVVSTCSSLKRTPLQQKGARTKRPGALSPPHIGILVLLVALGTVGAAVLMNPVRQSNQVETSKAGTETQAPLTR